MFWGIPWWEEASQRVHTDWPAPRLPDKGLDGDYRAGKAGSIPAPGMLQYLEATAQSG